MSATEAQIAANRKNAAKSTGPKTPEGKDASRRNAVKHGQSGDGTVVPVEDAEEVEQRVAEFLAELQPSGSLATTLVRRAATMAVRMERSAERQVAETTERVVRAVADCEIPDGVSAEIANQLRAEAGRLAAFDTSRDANLARRYEAAAERSFYRALREFRQLQKQAQAIQADRESDTIEQILGSIRQMRKQDEAFDARYPEMGGASLTNRLDPYLTAPIEARRSPVDVPITVGRRR